MRTFVGRAAVAVAVCMSLSVPTVAFANTTLHVKSGDTLWDIARANHVSVSALEQANGLHTTNLKIGQQIVIPDSTSQSTDASKSLQTEASRVVVVTVKKGDTISSIASRYGASTTATLKLNGLTSTSILHIGDKIKVVGQGTHVSSSRGESSAGNLGAEVLGLNIVNFAKQFLGVPYRWGGTSPSGFDCSGFVQFVYAHFGIPLHRTSYGQHEEGSTTSNPNIGDLVFFDTDGAGASHVGIYVGNDEFINAEDRGVRIDSLSSSYWARHYIGAKHIG